MNTTCKSGLTPKPPVLASTPAGAATGRHWSSSPHWLLAVAMALGWQPAAAQRPQAAPRVAAPSESVVVRGVALDDSLNVPIPGLWLYLNDTKYGAITDAQGAFMVSFPTGWRSVRDGVLRIKVATAPFTFKPLRVQLDWRHYDPAHPLTLRLASAPGRGRPNLHGYLWMAPPVPPPVYPARARTARP